VRETNVITVEFTPMPAPLVGKITQEEWDATPVVIRSETIRAVNELLAGAEKYRAASERDAELQEFHALATAGGTTLAAAMRRYIDIEDFIRRDPIEGFTAVIANMALDPVKLAEVIMSNYEQYGSAQGPRLSQEQIAKWLDSLSPEQLAEMHVGSSN
jgi:hypothetical protein